MTAETGAYVLLLRMPAPATVTVGKLGCRLFDQPYYAYAGSALGPGGLAARVGRHLKTDKKKHWHIDYLRELAEITAVWELVGQTRRECLLAGLLVSLKGASPVDGFGATDCRCRTHLVGMASLPRLDSFRRRLELSVDEIVRVAARLRYRGEERHAGSSR